MKENKNISSSVMMAAGPVIGLVFAIGLPFIGIAVLAKLIVQKTLALTPEPALATFGWRPSESYLTGRKKNKTD